MLLLLCFCFELFSINKVSADDVYVPKTSVGSKSLTIRGYSDNVTSGFRTSQTLEVIPNGFSSDAVYYYEFTSNSTVTPFDVISTKENHYTSIRQPNPLKSLRSEKAYKPYLEVTGNIFQKAAKTIANAAIAVANAAIELENVAIRALNAITSRENEAIQADNNCYSTSIGTYANVFRVHGNDASSVRIDIKVTDVNQRSATYNQSVTTSYGGFGGSNISYDVGIAYGMFMGDSENIYTLLMHNGIDTSGATITNVQVDGASIDYIYSATQGEKSLTYTISNHPYCSFDKGLSTTTIDKVYVFKKPTITSVAGGIEITNCEAGVTYSIGNRSMLCYSDSDKIIFNNLAVDADYELVLSKITSNGQIAKKRVWTKTLKPYTGYLNYEDKKNVIKPSNLQIYNKGDKVSAPNGPYAPGFVLENWYDDSSFTTVHNFNNPVIGDFTIYGKWDGLKSSINLKLTANGSPIKDAKVELYQNETKLFDLEEYPNNKGTYYIDDAVINGTYTVYIDGINSRSTIEVYTSRTSKDISAELLANRLSGDTLNISLNVKKLSVITYVDDIKSSITNSNINLFNGYRYDSTLYNTDAYISYYPSNDANDYDVYFNGSDTDVLKTNDKNKNVGNNKLSTNLYFNTITANVICDDDAWISTNICLRKENGAYVTSLTNTSFDSVSHTRKYTTVLMNDENATPTKYYIYVDGVNTESYVTSTKTGKDVTITFDTSKITLNKDGSPFTNAEIEYTNGSRTYNVTKNTNGLYTAHLLQKGEAYTYKIVGTIDSTTHTEYEDTLNYYSVNFKSYEKNEETDNNDLINYRSYTVLNNEVISKPKDAYYKGLAFNCWNETEYVENEGSQTSFDFTSEITSTHTLYAHFKKASVEINGFVKYDETTSTISSTGTSFIMPNIIIDGYGEGNVIKSIRAEFSNVTSFKLAEDSNVTLSCQTGTLPSASDDFYNFTGDNSVSITFESDVTVVDAQNYLRKIVVTPKESEEVTVKFTASDLPVSKYKESDWTYTTSTTDEIFTVITEGSTTGKTLDTGNYYIANDVSFSCANGNGLTINGNVKIYIPEGVTLTATGANGTAWNNPGKAGILLSEGNTLTVVGKGTLKATGGNATNGSNGSGAGSVYAIWGQNSNGLFVHTELGGGAGGYGGSGAGAGIGTNGGSGGAGGSAPSGMSRLVYVSEGHVRCGAGNNGSAGSKAQNCGDFKCYGIVLNVTGGSFGTGGNGGSSNTNRSSDVYTSHAANAGYVCAKSNWDNSTSTAVTGSGGGGGGGGQAARAIGNGGTGGGGGGSGSAGGIYFSSDEYGYLEKGGLGGAGATSGKNGSNNGGNKEDRGSRSGGASDNTGKEITYEDYNISEPLYSVKFDSTTFEGVETTYNYSYFTQKTIKALECITPTGLVFKGWKVVDAGSTYSDSDDPFTSISDDLYQPGSYTLTGTTSGNIVLKPIYEVVSAKYGEGSLTISSDAFTVEPTYYTYTINTKVDGSLKDIGNISLVNGTNEYVLASDGTGVYKYTTTEDLDFDIYYNGYDSNNNITKDSTVDLELSSMSLVITLDNTKTDNYSDIQFINGSSLLSPKQKYNPTALTGEYEYIDLTSKLEESYNIYINNEDTLIDIEPGESKEINYKTITVTIDGNATPDTSILRNEGTDLSMSFDSANKKLTLIGLEDTKEYHLYINNLDTEITTLAFNDDNKTANLTMNECVAKVYRNGTLLTDNAYWPNINSEKMENTGTGTYKKIVFGTIDKVELNGKEYTVNDGTTTINTYTALYDLNGGTGTTPIDDTVYYDGDDVTISSINDIKKENYQFVGWTLGDEATVYDVEETITSISERPLFTAAYKSYTDYDLFVSIGTDSSYLMANEFASYISKAGEDDQIDIKVLKNCTLPAISLKESDSLTINESLDNVIIASIENYGEVNIGSSSTVNVLTYVKNLIPSDTTILKKFTVSSSATLNVGTDFTNEKEVNNEGTINVTNGTLTSGEYKKENDIIITDTNAIINNNGTINLLYFENNGYYNNTNRTNISGENKEKTINNGVINNTGTLSDGNADEVTDGKGMINNSVINNANGHIRINVYNFSNVNGGDVINGRRIINKDAGTTENLSGNEDQEQKEKEEEQDKKKEEIEHADTNKNICYIVLNGGTADYSSLPYATSVSHDSDKNADKVAYAPIASADYTSSTLPEYALLLPTNLTKDGYTFDGFYASSDYSGDKQTKINVDEYGEKIFYAKWKNATSSDTKVDEVEQESGGYTIKRSAYCRVDSSIENATVSGLDLASKALFTDDLSNLEDATVDEASKIINLPDVKVVLSVSSSCDNESKDAIEEKVNDSEKVSFVDIVLKKYVGTDTVGTIIEETDTPIEIIIPYSNSAIPNPSNMLRYHDGSVEELKNNETHEDGTYYLEKDETTTTVHLFTSKFSGFGVAYVPPVASISAPGYYGYYDGLEHLAPATISNYEGATPLYSIDGGNTFTADVPSITDAGKIEAIVRAMCDGAVVGSQNYTLEVLKKPIKIETTPSANTLTYNGLDQTLITAGSIESGALDKAHIEYSLDGNTYSTSLPSAKDAGDYTIYYKAITDNNNYDGGDVKTLNVSVNKKEITVLGITSDSKEYDGTTVATLNFDNVTFTGLEEGDTLSLKATGTFSDKEVGNDKTVTISDYVLTGDDANNYKLASSGNQASTTANITGKNITVTITPNGGYYDSYIKGATAVLNGVAAKESVPVTLTYSGTSYDGTSVNGTTVPSKAGVYTVTASITSSSYTLTGETSTNFIVNKKIVNVPTLKNFTYDGKYHSNTVADVAGLYHVTKNNGGINAGSYSIELELEDNNNYRWSNVSSTVLDINTEALTTIYFKIGAASNYWLAKPSIPNVIYGNEIKPSSLAEYGDDKLVIYYEGINGTSYAYTNVEPHDVGEYLATFTIPSANNFDALIGECTFKILPREINIKWYAPSDLVYNKSIKTPICKAIGLINNDECKVNIEVTSGDAINVGDFKYKAISLTNKNYKLSEDIYSDTYTILPKEVEVTWKKTKFVYNGEIQYPIVTFEGLCEDDECEAIFDIKAKFVSTYNITITDLSNENYILKTNTSNSFEIIKADGVLPSEGAYTYFYALDGNPIIHFSKLLTYFDGSTIEYEISSNSSEILDSNKLEENATYYIRTKGNDNIKASDWVEIKAPEKNYITLIGLISSIIILIIIVIIVVRKRLKSKKNS